MCDKDLLTVHLLEDLDTLTVNLPTPSHSFRASQKLTVKLLGESMDARVASLLGC